jgi:F-type H+-transporting ATPase subunit alpha
MAYDIIEKLKKEIEGFDDKANWEAVGKVTEVGDGIIRLTGLRGTLSQELLTIETKEGTRKALALNLEEDSIGALVLDDYLAISTGDVVKNTGQVLSIQVGKEILGRVIDPLGNALDGKGDLYPQKQDVATYLLENRAPGVLERQPVDTPLQTGIKAIDSSIPIGRGQRELIIGDRQTGKTAIALDTIINQKNDKTKPVVCVYVAVGQKESKIATIIETLRREGALDYTVIVSAPASSPAAMWYLAPFAGAAIGEYFRDRGMDALVVYDDLSKHAWAYRQISLLLRRPPGREAYPGDVFYLHSRLLERAARMSEEKGGGSLTALPIIETQLGDITAYIPTNVISITDGQIFLESDLFYQGMRPAISVGLSVSRVGGAAQTKAIKKVVKNLRLELAQFRELQAFVQFASDVDEKTKRRIREGQQATEILKQEDLKPVPLEEQVVVFYAVLNKHFGDINPAEMGSVETAYLEYLRKFQPNILKEIREKKDLTKENEEKLKEAITHFLESRNS